jgi:hypothetical protein
MLLFLEERKKERKKEFSMPSMLGKRIVRIVKEELEAGRKLE